MNHELRMMLKGRMYGDGTLSKMEDTPRTRMRDREEGGKWGRLRSINSESGSTS